MKACIESYRKNYPVITVKFTDEQIANSTSPHWVAFKTAWTACNTVYREQFKREKARRIVAEEKLTELITPK